MLWHLYSRKNIENVLFVCFFLILSIWCLFGNVCHTREMYFTENEGVFVWLFCFVCILLGFLSF